jgi:hypothetical protein
MGTDKTIFVEVMRGGATGSHVTRSDVTGSIFCACPTFFPHYSSSTKSIGKPRVSPLLFLNTSAVIRYLICVNASHFFAGRPYHVNQTLRTANKF